jgi:hypothetical protein
MGSWLRLLCSVLGVATLDGCCESAFVVEAHGKVTTTEGAPIAGAEVRIRFEDDDPAAPCEALGTRSSNIVATTDAQGRYKTRSQAFSHSCGASAYVDGSICVTAPGFKPSKLWFDADDSPDPRVSGIDSLDVALATE